MYFLMCCTTLYVCMQNCLSQKLGACTLFSPVAELKSPPEKTRLSNVQWKEAQLTRTHNSTNSAPPLCFSLLRCWGKHPKIRATGRIHCGWSSFGESIFRALLNLEPCQRLPDYTTTAPSLLSLFNSETFTGSRMPLNFFHTRGSFYIKCDYVTVPIIIVLMRSSPSVWAVFMASRECLQVTAVCLCTLLLFLLNVIISCRSK